VRNINSEKTKSKVNKSRVIFVMSVIFLITSFLTKIHSTSLLLKENKSNEREINLNKPKKHVFKKEINKHTEEINYILAISDTLGEAINYIEQNYKNDTNEQVKTILKDSIVGITSISSALETMYNDLDDKNIKIKTNNLDSQLNELMHALDDKNIVMAETIMTSKLLNEYTHWKSAIEIEFR
jgi:type II secretory pathway component PulF